MRKRLLSLLLVACMVLPMIPVMALSAFATEGDGTYSTNFSADPTNPNFPTLDLPAATPVVEGETSYNIGETYSYADVTAGQKLSGKVSFNGNWEVGSFPVEWDSTTGAVTVKEGFLPYNILQRDGTTDVLIFDGGIQWGSLADGRGGALFMDSTLEWVLAAGMNYGSSGDRYVKSYYSTSGIRYTAEYTGTVDITAALGFFADNGMDVAILHNTTVVATIENDGTAVKAAGAGNVDFGEVVSDLAVRTGDVIAFVNIGDSSYNQDATDFDYNKGKRGFRNFDFTITYAEGYYAEEIEIWDGLSNANIVRNAANNTDLNMYFFAWYQADGTRINPMAGGKLNADCYAVVNDYLLENGVVAEDDTYAEAMEKYRAYLKEQTYIAYNGSWSFGANTNGAYSAIAYPSYLDQRNPYMVRTSGSGNIVAEFATSRWVSETNFDKMFDSYYAASWQGNATKNATIPQEDTLLSDIRISYTTDLHPSGSQGNGMAYAPTTNEAVGGVEGMCYSASEMTNVFYVRPGNGMAAGSFAYTAAKAGVVELKVNSVSFVSSNKSTTQNQDTKWALFINGVQQTNFETVTNSNGSNPADAINATLAEFGEIGVCAGDIVEIVCVRGATGGAHVNMSITSVMNDSRVPVRYESGDKVLQSTIVKKGEALPALVGYDAFGISGYMINGVYATELPATVEDGLVIADFFINSSASLTIAGDFAINVYVEGGETVTGAGVVVDGIRQAGVLQPDGTYKVTVATIAAKDLLTTNVNYLSYQYHNDGTYRLSRAFTKLESAAMLEAYTNGSMGAAVKEVAQSVVDYAYIADIYFNGKTLASNDPVKNRLKGAFTILNGQNGANHTNYNSGAYDVMLATLKMYSIDGYVPVYADQYQDPVTGKTDTFVPWADFLKSDRVEWGFGDQNPTDSAYKFAINAVTLNLAEKIGFALSIQANGEGSLDDLVAGGSYKLKVCIGGGIVEYYDAFLYVDETKSAKALLVDGVPTGFFDQDYEFTVVEETEDGYVDVSATLTYGVDAWCVENYQFCAGAVKDYLLKAIYRMGIAADAYLRS